MAKTKVSRDIYSKPRLQEFERGDIILDSDEAPYLITYDAVTGLYHLIELLTGHTYATSQPHTNPIDFIREVEADICDHFRKAKECNISVTI